MDLFGRETTARARYVDDKEKRVVSRRLAEMGRVRFTEADLHRAGVPHAAALIDYANVFHNMGDDGLISGNKGGNQGTVTLSTVRPWMDIWSRPTGRTRDRSELRPFFDPSADEHIKPDQLEAMARRATFCHKQRWFRDLTFFLKTGKDKSLWHLQKLVDGGYEPDEADDKPKDVKWRTA